MSGLDEEQAQPLSIGVVVDSTVENRPWRDAARELTIRVADVRADLVTPLNVNVVFHIGGRSFKPEFSGIRTGSFSKRRSLLMVQVALPKEVPPDPKTYLKQAVYDALDSASQWADRRHVSSDIAALRSIVDRA
ncbi:MAG: hypothetical protein ACYDHH_29620 [Solirubrobacteraceae bacterium]